MGGTFARKPRQPAGGLMTYSYTQISQYLTCPRLYRHRYLDGWKEKDTRAAMLFGRAFETALGASCPACSFHQLGSWVSSISRLHLIATANPAPGLCGSTRTTLPSPTMGIGRITDPPCTVIVKSIGQSCGTGEAVSRSKPLT